MNCDRFEEYLKEQLDLETFMTHMNSCVECQKAYQTDARIMKESMELNENLSIPDFWSTIEKDLQRENPKVIKFNTTTKLILAAAATFLIITTIWMFNSFPKNTPTTRILSQRALEKVKVAEENYQEAIKDLELLAYHQLETTPGPLAQLYRNKLSLIERQIDNCKNALKTNPANSHIRAYLMAALQDKQKTLEEIIKYDS